jgi:hypothetical protein
LWWRRFDKTAALSAANKALRGVFFSIFIDRQSQHRRRPVCADPITRQQEFACNKRARKWSAQLSYLG